METTAHKTEPAKADAAAKPKGDPMLELLKILQDGLPLSPAASSRLDDLRVSLGDKDRETHVLVYKYDNALLSGNAKEVESLRAALDKNPAALKLLDQVDKARRTNTPLVLESEKGGH
jgi:hypothetical protein